MSRHRTVATSREVTADRRGEVGVVSSCNEGQLHTRGSGYRRSVSGPMGFPRIPASGRDTTSCIMSPDGRCLQVSMPLARLPRLRFEADVLAAIGRPCGIGVGSSRS